MYAYGFFIFHYYRLKNKKGGHTIYLIVSIFQKPIRGLAVRLIIEKLIFLVEAKLVFYKTVFFKSLMGKLIKRWKTWNFCESNY